MRYNVELIRDWLTGINPYALFRLNVQMYIMFNKYGRSNTLSQVWQLIEQDYLETTTKSRNFSDGLLEQPIITGITEKGRKLIENLEYAEEILNNSGEVLA